LTKKGNARRREREEKKGGRKGRIFWENCFKKARLPPVFLGGEKKKEGEKANLFFERGA